MKKLLLSLALLNFGAFAQTTVVGNGFTYSNGNVTVGSTLSAGAVVTGTSSTNTQLVADGDSLTVGLYGSQPYTALLTLSETMTVSNVAVAGRNLSDMIDAAPVSVDAKLAISGRRSVVVIWGGTNNLMFMLPDGVYSQLRAYCAARRRAGFQVIAATTISRGGSGAQQTAGQTLDSLKNQYNALIRAHYTEFADGLADIASSASLGADGAYSSGTYFQSDQTHLTDAGYALVAGIVSQAVNNLIAGPNAENLFIQSENVAYPNFDTNGANGFPATPAASPDGGMKAFKIPEQTGTGYHLFVNHTAIGTATGAIVTASFAFKAAERTYAIILFQDPGLIAARFNLSTGAVDTVGTGLTATIAPHPLGGGWYICTVTRTTASASPLIYFGPLDASGGSGQYAGTVGNGIYVWHPQVNYGSTALPYTPTVASPVTRPGLMLFCPAGQTAKPTAIVSGQIATAVCSL